MVRNGLPNKPKHNASRMVDLPEPFSPMMSVVEFFVKSISVKVFPVDRKFFHLTFLKFIKVLSPVLQYIMTASYF